MWVSGFEAELQSAVVAIFKTFDGRASPEHEAAIKHLYYVFAPVAIYCCMVTMICSWKARLCVHCD